MGSWRTTRHRKQPMSWEKEVDELREQTEFAKEMGGADSVAFHHSRGRLTVRERIGLLEDPGTFHEVGSIAGTAQWEDDAVVALKPANSVVGTVHVDGRKVAVSGGDFTIRGGAADAAVGNKGGFAEQFALQARIPYVRLLDATGGSVKTFEKMGRTYLPGNAGTNLSAELLQFVPVV
ncbi:MAG: methylmalonyl-CoA carboxyltransferase, partial [Gammaproteobacteria bacterium]|nr:methylmalonyl-CoA carboxyltransferase [Gammaproteobacteria bacterium]